jgi:hypothetical protein
VSVREAVELCHLVAPAPPSRHYEGWTQFRQGRAGIEHELAAAPDEARSIRSLPIGEATTGWPGTAYLSFRSQGDRTLAP